MSAGDLLRAERNTPGSKYGDLIENHIRNGTIVPVEITCSLIEQAIDKERDINKNAKFLIDGFPRSQGNLEGWEKQMGSKVNLKFVLFFDCPKETCIERCLKRGATGSGRSDDNIDSMNKRMDTYFNDTMPIIEYYNKLNLVRKINASKTPDEVFDCVRNLFV